MIEITEEQYMEALRITEEYSGRRDYELELDNETRLRGILKALRVMLRTKEGESILYRCGVVMRRFDNMSKELKRYPND